MKNQLSKFIILLVVLIALLFGVFYFDKIINNKVESIKAKKETIENNKILPNQEEVLNRLTDLNIKIDKLNSYLVDLSNPVLFIEEIESLAFSNQLSIKVNSFNAPETKTKDTEEEEGDFVVQELTLDFSVSGSLQNIREFISDLENMNKNINVNSVRVSRSVAEDAVIWTAIIELNVLAK